jgi:hypothetical protein
MSWAGLGSGGPVGGGAESDPPVGFGAGASFDEGFRVEPVGDLAGDGDALPVPHALELLGVTGQLGVHGLAAGQGEAGGLPGEQLGPPLGDPTGAPSSHGVRDALGKVLHDVAGSVKMWLDEKLRGE